MCNFNSVENCIINIDADSAQILVPAPTEPPASASGGGVRSEAPKSRATVVARGGGQHFFGAITGSNISISASRPATVVVSKSGVRRGGSSSSSNIAIGNGIAQASGGGVAVVAAGGVVHSALSRAQLGLEKLVRLGDAARAFDLLNTLSREQIDAFGISPARLRMLADSHLQTRKRARSPGAEPTAESAGRLRGLQKALDEMQGRDRALPDDDSERAIECPICQERRKCVALKNCGHIPSCVACALRLEEGGQIKCPECRELSSEANFVRV